MQPAHVGFVASAILAVAAAGCSGPKKPDYPTVSGRVTYGGKPLTDGNIRLSSEDSRCDASGPINSQGRFVLVFKTPIRPLPPGRYLVTVSSWLEKPGTERPDGTFSKGVSAIPLRYRDQSTSGFFVDMSPGTMNALTVALPAGESVP